MVTKVMIRQIFFTKAQFRNFKFFHHKTVEYWNGDKGLNETGCTCSETNSCEKQNGFDSDRKCNCDDKRPGMVDVGVLTSLDQEGC